MTGQHNDPNNQSKPAEPYDFREDLAELEDSDIRDKTAVPSDSDATMDGTSLVDLSATQSVHGEAFRQTSGESQEFHLKTRYPKLEASVRKTFDRTLRIIAERAVEIQAARLRVVVGDRLEHRGTIRPIQGFIQAANGDRPSSSTGKLLLRMWHAANLRGIHQDTVGTPFEKVEEFKEAYIADFSKGSPRAVDEKELQMSKTDLGTITDLSSTLWTETAFNTRGVSPYKFQGEDRYIDAIKHEQNPTVEQQIDSIWSEVTNVMAESHERARKLLIQRTQEAADIWIQYCLARAEEIV